MITNDEQLIRNLFSEWHRATADGNLDKLLTLMDPDVLFLVTGQSPMKGRDGFAAGFQKALQQFRIESSGTIEGLEVSGTFAYMWTHLSVSMIPLKEGETIQRSGYTLTILRKTLDGNWVLYRDANMLKTES